MHYSVASRLAAAAVAGSGGFTLPILAALTAGLLAVAALFLLVSGVLIEA